MSDFSLRCKSVDGTKSSDITQLVQSLSWSGSWRDCARQISCSVLPSALVELGGQCTLTVGEKTVFTGTIVSRARDSLGQTIEVTAMDGGIYLKRNSTYCSARNQTPEAFAAGLCGQYGIPVGSLASTGVKLSRNFLGISIYQIIQTMYTLASEQNGKQYQVRFRGRELDVVEKKISEETLRLVPGSNLLACQSKDSIQDMINRVAVYDDEEKRLTEYTGDNNYIALYGLMEKAIRSGSYDDPEKAAKELLSENGITTTITADCLGHEKLITGNSVAVHEPVTGTDGLFWIQSDQHSWSRGIHRTKVTLDFRNLMDKQTAGSVPTK